VLGVAAYGRSGNVPAFSNRDKQFVDIAAPGTSMFSLFPRNLTAKFTGCVDQGYSNCGTMDFRPADGTSFASPQVAAAAALLFGEVPSLRPDQVSRILKETADDATPANGCVDCTVGVDALTGHGRLNVDDALTALQNPSPPADRLEPNDDAGDEAAIVATPRAFTATLDWYDDPNDVYKIHLDKGERLSVVVHEGDKVDPSLFLWKPGLTSLAAATSDLRARRSIHGPGIPERIRYRAPREGWYYVQVKLATPGVDGFGAYRIRLAF
jgi:hypothetical protein